MGKKILSLVLVLCMAAFLLPATARAKEIDLSVGNTEVSSGNAAGPIYWKAADGGEDEVDYEPTGDTEDWLFSVSYDAEIGYTLTLNNVHILSSISDCGIRCDDNLTIVLPPGTVNSIGGAERGIETIGNLTITGSGALEIIVESDFDDSAGIRASGDITVSDTALSIIQEGSYGVGVSAGENIIIQAADVFIIDWGSYGDCGLFSDTGSIDICGNSYVDICSQDYAISASQSIVMKGDLTGNPIVNINDPASIEAITPEIQGDFQPSRSMMSDSIEISNSTLNAFGGIRSRGSAPESVLAISGVDTLVNITSDDSYCMASENDVFIEDATVNVTLTDAYGNAVRAIGDIIITGNAVVNIVDWSTTDGKKCGLHSEEDVNIGGNAYVDICSQNIGIFAAGSFYFGYDRDMSGGGYTAQGSPILRINQEDSIAAAAKAGTPFEPGTFGILANESENPDGNITIAGGFIYAYAAGKNAAGIATGGSFNMSGGFVMCAGAAETDENISTAVYFLGDFTLPDAYAYKSNTEAVQPEGGFIYQDYVYDINDRFLNIASIYALTKTDVENGDYTMMIDGSDAEFAAVGDTVVLEAVPESGFTLSGFTVYKTGDRETVFPVSNASFIMPVCDVTVEAVFGYNSPPVPVNTITVTQTSAGLFENSPNPIIARANMNGAFTSSVEVKITDAAQGSQSFGFGIGHQVFPLDISLYIKGTDTKTKPEPGYAVTIYLPVPPELLDRKESLFVVHQPEGETATVLLSRLEQIDGAWYLVFEASDFSPFALVVKTTQEYDEAEGLPYWLDDNGNKMFIGFSGGRKYLSPDSVLVLFAQNPKRFSDCAGHWAKTDIDFIAERDIFIGTAAETFSPDMRMTRAMFVTAIGRLYERSFGLIEDSGAQLFSDCDTGAEYGRYVNWAAENGITEGYGNGLFKPEQIITREQLAVFLYRFAGFLGILSEDTAFSPDFPDSDSISAWAISAAGHCQASGMISGRDNGFFNPQSPASRAEAAAVLHRLINAVLQ